jgi:hypothetical protein
MMLFSRLKINHMLTVNAYTFILKLSADANSLFLTLTSVGLWMTHRPWLLWGRSSDSMDFDLGNIMDWN